MERKRISYAWFKTDDFGLSFKIAYNVKYKFFTMWIEVPFREFRFSINV